MSSDCQGHLGSGWLCLCKCKWKCSSRFFRSCYSWKMATSIGHTEVTWRIWSPNKTALNEDDGRGSWATQAGLVTWQWGDRYLRAHCRAAIASAAEVLPSATWGEFLTTLKAFSFTFLHSVWFLWLFSSFFLSPWLLIMPSYGKLLE